jgi:hypothetical protein
MADLTQIEKRIRELAGRRRNVQLKEIEWVVNQLRLNGYDTGSRTNGHQTLFRVGTRKFGVCGHNPGGKQIKACYVDEFIDAMIDIGLYDE